MSQFIQGNVETQGVNVKILGINNKFSYRFVTNEETLRKQEIKAVPALIVDFSWSMQNSNSAKPALQSVKETCKKLFEDGNEKIHIVFFGKTAYLMTVQASNYLRSIDEKMTNYFNTSYFFETDGCFNPTGTLPELAFIELFNEIKKNPQQKYNIIFMTDGEFNGSGNYASKWQQLVTTYLPNLKCELEFFAIGYQDDHLKNIIEMKNAFDKANCTFNYYTISSSNQIEPKMKEVTELFESYKLAKIVLPNGDQLTEGETYFSDTLLFKDINASELVNFDNLPKGITREWLLDVMELTLELGLKEQSVISRMKQAVSQKNSKQLYQEMVKELSLYYNNLPQRFLTLRNQVKSLKSRGITKWIHLNERLQSFTTVFREIQELVTNELNEKKEFEKATNIANSVRSRHLRTLQRRRINNEANRKQDEDFNVEVVTSEPLKLSYQSSKNNYESCLESSLKDLEEYYTCFYSQDNWSGMLNTLVGIPIKYSWKEGDDWTPSRANIENVSMAGFISQEGFEEVQNLFGGQKLEHTALYKNQAYLKSAHDGTNAYLPIATDPFFLSKIHLVKDRLGHMIAGSNLAFASRHVLLYVAVIRQLVNMMVDNSTEKLEHTLLLVLNTFRLLSTRCNSVFSKEQSPLSKPEILLNISTGNTAPYLFCGSWDSAVFALISSSSDYEKARELYNSQNNKSLSTNEFKTLVWTMIYRHFLIMKYELDSKFEDPLEWGLPTQQEVKNKLNTYLLTMNYENAITEINKEMMTCDKLNSWPQYIKTQVQKTVTNRMTKVFNKLLELVDSLNDETWHKLNKTFVPFRLQISDSIRNNFSEQLESDLAFKTYFECLVYGQKDCFPLRSHSELEKHIVNRINNNYGDQIRQVLGDAYELAEFRKRQYETRALPVIFTSDMEFKVNELFGDTFNNKVTEEEFKVQMRSILGNYSCKYFDEALVKDNLDVLQRLYNYCKTRVHSLTIKSTRLPFSCPANPTSALFLQKLTDVEFSHYFKPLGFGWSTKKYQSWVSDLHPFMNDNLYRSEEDFIRTVLEHVKTFKPVDFERYEEYVRLFHRTFKATQLNTSSITSGQKNSSYYF